MDWEDIPKFLPAILGVLRQKGAEGALTLEQNDGRRLIYWQNGNIVFLQSDVAGEQFGNYLLRQGILDLSALNEILSDGDKYRLGERVIQAGLMTVSERDTHLRQLQEQIMIHSLEHAIIELKWDPRPLHEFLPVDLQFQINHHNFIWYTFHQTKNLGDICDLLYSETSWQWEAPEHLLNSVSDLPLNPKWAFALTFFGAEPIGFETFISLGNLDDHEASRLIVTLWALGSLSLTRDQLLKISDGPWKSKSRESKHQVTQAASSYTAIAKESFNRSSTHRIEIAPDPNSSLINNSQSIELDSDVNIDINSMLSDISNTESQNILIGASSGNSVSDSSKIPTSVPDTNSSQEDIQSAQQIEHSLSRANELFNKAESFVLQDRISEAIKLLEQAVQLDPDSIKSYNYWLLLGKLRLSNPAWSSRSIDALQKASKIQPSSGEPWAVMGEIYLRKGFMTNAVACFKRAIELDPSLPVPDELINITRQEPMKESSGILERLGEGFKSILRRKDS